MYRLAVAVGILLVALVAPFAAAGPVEDTVGQATAAVHEVGAWTSTTLDTSRTAAEQDASAASGGNVRFSHAPSGATWSEPRAADLVIEFPVPDHAVDGLVDDITDAARNVPLLHSTRSSSAPNAPESAPPIPRAYIGHAAPDAPAAAPIVPAASLAAVAVVTAAAPAVASGGLWARLRRFAFLASPLYTRIAKERLLDHGARERLLDAVRAQPGSSLADIARASDLARNTAVYHMFRLEREGLVSSLRNGRARLYFAPGALEQRERAPAMAAVKHPMSASIAREVGATPGVDQRAICARFGLAPSLAHWHAKRLVQAGVVEQRRDGRYVRYYPGANFSAAMSG